MAARAPPGPSFVLRGRSGCGPINCVDFGPPAQRDAEPHEAVRRPTLLAGSGNGECTLWDLESRRVVWAFQAHGAAADRGGVLSARWVGAAQDRILTQGRDGRVGLWAVGSGGCPSPLAEVDTGSLTFCQAAHAATASGGGDDGAGGLSELLLAAPCERQEVVCLWDLRQKRAVGQWDLGEGAGAVMTVTFVAPGGEGGSERLLAAGTESGAVALWSPRAGREVARLVPFGEQQPLMCAALVPSRARKGSGGPRLVVGSAGGSLAVVRVTDGPPGLVQECEIPLTGEGTAHLAVRGDGRLLAAAGWDHRVRLFATKDWRPLALLRFHAESVHAVSFAPAPHLGTMASASKDGRIAVYEDLYSPGGGRDGAGP